MLTSDLRAGYTVRDRRLHVHRIPSRVRDDHEPPLCGTGWLEYASDLVVPPKQRERRPQRKATCGRLW